MSDVETKGTAHGDSKLEAPVGLTVDVTPKIVVGSEVICEVDAAAGTPHKYVKGGLIKLPPGGPTQSHSSCSPVMCQTCNSIRTIRSGQTAHAQAGHATTVSSIQTYRVTPRVSSSTQRHDHRRMPFIIG